MYSKDITTKLIADMRATEARHERAIHLDELNTELAESRSKNRQDKATHEREIQLMKSMVIEKSLKPKSDLKLSSFIKPYFDGMPAESRPNAKTLESYNAAINTFIKIVGDKLVDDLSIADQNRFEDVIFRLPSNSTKIQSSKHLGIDEMIALRLKSISIQSAKNIARRTNSFLSWTFRRLESKPPFVLLETTKITKRKKAKKVRRPFTDLELAKVFDPQTFASSNQPSPYMFWLPLIALHSGMRINEIAQFSISDLVVISGIDCFNVTDEPDIEDYDDCLVEKHLKTEAAKRLVPVHPKLLELGLLEYAKALKDAKFVRLFPDLVGGRDGPGQPASKQFARYCDRIKLTDRQLVFHSFRHGVIGRMRAARQPKELRKLVVGHSAIEDTHDAYGDMDTDYTALDRRDAIHSISYEGVIDYAGLQSISPKLGDLKKALRRQQTR